MSATPPGDLRPETRRRGGKAIEVSRRLVVGAGLAIATIVTGLLVLLDATPSDRPDPPRTLDGMRRTQHDTVGSPGDLPPIAASARQEWVRDTASAGADVHLPPAEVDALTPRPLLHRVGGRVVDADGLPLADAEVAVFLPAEQASRHAPEVRRVTRTDADGSFGFPDLPAAPTFIESGLAGYVWAELRLDPAGISTEHTVELVMTRSGSIHGLVRDDEGRFADGCRVSARRTVMVFDRHGSSSREGATDSQGRFVLEGLIPGEYVLSFRNDRIADSAQPEVARVEVRAGEAPSVELRLPTPGRVTGLVLYQGDPILDCTVTYKSGDMVLHSKTDFTGAYELEVPLACSGHITAVQSVVGMTPWEPLEIVSGYTKTKDLRFADTRLLVRVVDSRTRAPLPKVNVRFAAFLDSEPGDRSFTRTTNADGLLVAEHLFPGSWRLAPSAVHSIGTERNTMGGRHVTVKDGPYLDAEPTDVVVTEEGPAEVTLTLVEGVRIGGVVREASGEPTRANLWVYVLRRDQTDLRAKGYPVEQGRWSAHGLAGGDYDVLVATRRLPYREGRRDRLEELTVARTAVQLTTGETLEVDLELPPPSSR